ncbi:MAG: pentapeptide repeat-containing protein, partial [Magnetococcales bacterium]|nr:pentapeptide repeat-containing protein [Magnetococcales bacterium]
ARSPHLHVVITGREILSLARGSDNRKEIPTLCIKTFDEARITHWISRWNGLPHDEKHPSTLTFDGLQERDLLELTSTPLFLLIVAFLYGKELLEARTYRGGEVFRIFFNKTESGKFYKDRDAGVHELPENYREILRTIALVISRQEKASEQIAVEDLHRGVRLHLTAGRATGWRRLRALFRVRKQNRLERDLDRLFDAKTHLALVAHQFRITHKKKKTYFAEFAHKAFRQYLLAEALFEFLMSKQGDPSGAFDWQQWYQLGRPPLTAESGDFLSDLIHTMESPEELLALGQRAARLTRPFPQHQLHPLFNQSGKGACGDAEQAPRVTDALRVVAFTVRLMVHSRLMGEEPFNDFRTASKKEIQVLLEETTLDEIHTVCRGLGGGDNVPWVILTEHLTRCEQIAGVLRGAELGFRDLRGGMPLFYAERCRLDNVSIRPDTLSGRALLFRHSSLNSVVIDKARSDSVSLTNCNVYFGHFVGVFQEDHLNDHRLTMDELEVRNTYYVRAPAIEGSSFSFGFMQDYLMAKSGIQGSVFRDFTISGNHFLYCDLRRTDFIRCTFTKTVFEGCDFERVTFSHCTFRETRFIDCTGLTAAAFDARCRGAPTFDEHGALIQPPEGDAEV